MSLKGGLCCAQSLDIYVIATCTTTLICEQTNRTISTSCEYPRLCRVEGAVEYTLKLIHFMASQVLTGTIKGFVIRSCAQNHSLETNTNIIPVVTLLCDMHHAV